MSEQKSQQTKKVAILGPQGTFSHQVLTKNYPSCIPIFTDTIREVYEKVHTGTADTGIAPIENSIGGTIGESLDSLTEFDLQINKEFLLKVEHNLCGNEKDKDKIERLFCHPQTYSQCQKYIRKHLKNAKVIMAVSNSDSAKLLIENNEETSAAILPKTAASIYELPIIEANIQDNDNNTTRFIEISKTKNKEHSKESKTTISISPSVDKPGLLYEILGYFANSNINLTKIESRPNKGKLGNYTFFIDITGDEDNQKVRETFEKIKKVGNLTVFGSYKKEY